MGIRVNLEFNHLQFGLVWVVDWFGEAVFGLVWGLDWFR